MSEEGPFASSY